MSDAVLLTSPTRAQIEALEVHLAALPQREIVTEHMFAPGLYMRKMIVPPDTLLTGAVHTTEHISIMVSGDITMNSPEGMVRLSGYHEWLAPPGTKRVGYVHAETVWLTVHATDKTTVEEVENEIVENPAILLGRRQLEIA